jgi:hypothetical protein
MKNFCYNSKKKSDFSRQLNLILVSREKKLREGVGLGCGWGDRGVHVPSHKNLMVIPIALSKYLSTIQNAFHISTYYDIFCPVSVL